MELPRIGWDFSPERLEPMAGLMGKSDPEYPPVIVTAVLDRLLHHSVVVNIRGNSYRLRKNNENETIKVDQDER